MPIALSDVHSLFKYFINTYTHGRRNLDTNPLMSSLLVICLGWCSNFVGSESGQKQSVKLLQNMVYSTIQHPPPPRHTLYVYSTIHLVWEGGEVREKVEGQQYTSIVSSMGVTVHNLG
jgi:hypothetical protein